MLLIFVSVFLLNLEKDKKFAKSEKQARRQKQQQKQQQQK